MKNKIENLYRQKLKLENDDSIKTVEYIKCLANINYFTVDRDKRDFSYAKLLCHIGIETAYGAVDGEIFEEIEKALDLIFVGDFKGYCLFTAIIEVLEKITGSD